MFNSCSSCNRSGPPDWIVLLAILFVAAIAILLGWMVLGTLLGA